MDLPPRHDHAGPGAAPVTESRHVLSSRPLLLAVVQKRSWGSEG